MSLSKKAQPVLVAPMLATLTKKYFSDPNWIFECKLDGMRCLLFKNGTKITIYSRREVLKSWRLHPVDLPSDLPVSGPSTNTMLHGRNVNFASKVAVYEDNLGAKKWVQEGGSQRNT